MAEHKIKESIEQELDEILSDEKIRKIVIALGYL